MILYCVCVCVSEWVQILCDPMDYSLPGYSIYGMDSPGKTTGVGFSALL